MSDKELIPAYLSLGAQALAPIILGSFKSLKTPASTIAKRKKAAQAANRILTEDEEDEEDDTDEETLTWSDSLFFPIFGSIALVGLWLLLKYVGKEWINFVLGLYFSGAGVFAFQSTFSSLVNFSIRQTSYKAPIYHIRITSNLKQIYHQSISLSSVILLPFSIALPLLYVPLGRPWVLSNVLALSLGTATLALLRLDSFLTAFLLLGVLLIYDIFWVFATPVMVTVAKGIDAPIKLLAPKPGSSRDFAMLGLGDIVIPGLVIALCLRFDLYRHTLKYPQREITKYSSFGRLYFWTGIVSYIIGLATTMGVMHHFKAAQPALLYLSPACTIGPILVALIRGELPLLWSYTEGSENKEDKKDDTIEAPSEAAMKARKAVSNGQAEEVAQEVLTHAEDQDGTGVGGDVVVVEDESWMEDGKGVSTAVEQSKGKKRRGGKK